MVASLERCATKTLSMPLLDLRPKLSSLECLHVRGCSAPMWEDPAQKSLSDLIAPSPTADLVQR